MRPVRWSGQGALSEPATLPTLVRSVRSEEDGRLAQRSLSAPPDWSHRSTPAPKKRAEHGIGTVPVRPQLEVRTPANPRQGGQQLRGLDQLEVRAAGQYPLHDIAGLPRVGGARHVADYATG